MKIYVIGHISPDLDAIAAAVEYAEFLKKVKRYEGANIVALRAGDANKETQFVFSKFGIEVPQHIEDITVATTDAFILVDHNEEDQRHAKVPADQVIEIVDHHKIKINFTSPIRLDVKPLGSTSTLVHEQFEMYGIKPSDEAASLMLAAILSDTVGLKSSTTTGYDSETAHKLATNLSLDLDTVTFEIFKAKSDITGMSAHQIATKDYKIFDFGGKPVFINQIETVEPTKVLGLKDEIVATMNNLKAELGAAQTYTIVTDILKINSQAIYTTPEEEDIINKAFTTQGNQNLADIGPKMSRKKDIAPAIEAIVKA